MTSTTSTSAPLATLALVIGRWQMPHLGHQCLFAKAFEVAERVLIVIGSAYRSRDPRNPFNWEERRAMILSTLTPSERDRVDFLPVRDYFDNDRWNGAVAAGVAERTTHGEVVTLVGWKKDQTSDYLDNFPGWTSTLVPPSHSIDATSLRDVYFGSSSVSAAMTVLVPFLRPEVLAYLEAWSHLPTYKERVAEHLAVRKYKSDWGPGPFLTADAIVTASDRVLLIRRGKAIGKGLWALPGGHMEPFEQFRTAAERELKEETGFFMLPETMRAAFKGATMFDHPLRSPRARVLTMAHRYDFGDMACQEVKAHDDADQAEWVLISDLAAMEHLLFEDHAVILDREFGFLPAVGV